MIKGSVIYEPRGQALEYAPLATNPYRGCGHECLYCYVPLATKIDRAEFNAGAVLRDGYIERLRKDAAKFQAAQVTDQIMLSFSTDPYHLDDTAPTRHTLQILRDHGLAFCTLTKGGSRALRDLDLFRPSADAFASTMTSFDDAFSRKWERRAALPADRALTLERFHDAGIFTWISLEPTLSAEHSIEVIRRTHRYVDLYKVGRANYLKEITAQTDWRDYTCRVLEMLFRYGKAHYIKKDLQPFLPPGHPNPLRVQQNHATEQPAARCPDTMDLFA